MADLAYIRHLVHAQRWSSARAHAGSDALALAYVRAHADRAVASPTRPFQDALCNLCGDLDSYPHRGDGRGNGAGFGDRRGNGWGGCDQPGCGNGDALSVDRGDGDGRGEGERVAAADPGDGGGDGRWDDLSGVLGGAGCGYGHGCGDGDGGESGVGSAWGRCAPL